MKEIQRRYEKKLRENGITRSVPYQMKCHKEHDADVIEFMSKIENKSGFMKQLVRSFMNNQIIDKIK